MHELGEAVSSSPSQRVPSLDGLRAVSIALVFAHHVAGTPGSVMPASLANYLALGELGVRVFFVISGYLITGLLLQELNQHETIRLGRFYFRRTMRIFPPYYAFVLALAVGQATGLLGLLSGDILHAFTYTSNYHPIRSWYTGHTWSLGVEEQFYLLWPAVLLLAGRRRGMMVAASMLLLCPMIRLAESQLLPQFESGLGHRFETMADALAVGCLLAGLRDRLIRQPLYSRLLKSRFFVLVPAIVILTNLMHDHWRPFIAVGFTVMNVGIALTVDWCVTNHQGRIGRFLNARPVVYVGIISYSLYLWQQLFLNRSGESVVNIFPLNLMLAILAALVSFYLIERPSLALRRRIENRWFSDRKQRSRLPVRSSETEILNQPVGDALMVSDGLDPMAVGAVAGKESVR